MRLTRSQLLGWSIHHMTIFDCWLIVRMIIHQLLDRLVWCVDQFLDQLYVDVGSPLDRLNPGDV